ncbi:putative endonuclease [Arboricoccus pini]|uniref:UPF0102 protein SAMN07250955_107196 n=1 Tax=Arboricoccus pini TaxID=1963835 RepID=A0A212RDY3_9PROT|nr:YraN family protein [Arboricoccus pini]SNB70428.1 putative endonuclease [Arboricoccus pini]
MSGRRRAAERAGRLAEALAAWSLRLKAYSVIARRLRTPAGEIDLIARRGRVLVFVEVKLRSAGIDGLMALQPRQQRRIRNAASWYLGHRPELADLDCRFDLVIVTPWRLPRHVQDIWRD